MLRSVAGDGDFQLMLGIMSKSQSSHSTRNGSYIGDEWLKMKGGMG
jgi:hypothetical protein